MDIDKVCFAACTELRENKARQKVTLPMHVKESGGDEDTGCAPPGEWMANNNDDTTTHVQLNSGWDGAKS